MVTDRKVSVRLDADVAPFVTGLLKAAAASKTLANDLDKTEKSSKKLSDALDTSNDRTTLLVQSALALGPALVPLGAAGIPIVMGLATQMTFAAGAAGVTALAFSGVGDSLKAVNEYAIEPSVENFEKMNEEMAKLGPAGRDFVLYLQELRPQLQVLQDIAQEGMLPGAQEGIESLMTLLPQMERIVGTMADTIGDLFAQGGETLAGPEFEAFFSYIENEARPILTEMGQTFGNFFQTFANLMVAFGPLTSDFSGDFLQMSRDIEEWSKGLAETDGFKEFSDYITENGPKVWDTLGSISQAIFGIVEALAPVGAASLPVIEALMDALGAIARSPAGPVLFGAAAGLSALSRAIALAKVVQLGAISTALSGISVNAIKAGKASFVASGQMRSLATGAAILGLALTDVDDKAGLSNTAMGALLGTMAGPYGAAAGAAIGFTMDLAAANNDLTDAYEAAQDALDSQDPAKMREGIAGLNAEIAATEDALSTGFFSMDKPKQMFAGLNEIVPIFGKNTSQAQEKVDELKGSLTGIIGGSTLFGSSIITVGREMRAAARDAEDLARQLETLSAFFDKRSAIRGYEESIDALREGLRDGADDWRESTAAGRENLELLDANVTAMLQVAEKMKPGSAAQKSFLTDARKQLIAFKEEFPGAAAAIDKILGRLNNQLDGFEKTRKPRLDVTDDASRKINLATDKADDFDKKRPRPTLDANDGPFRGKLTSAERLIVELITGNYEAEIDGDASGVIDAVSAARGYLNGIDGDTATTYIRTVRTGSPGPQMGIADGATVPGPRFPYGDKVPALLAPGEEVISNRHGQADRWRGFLKAVNANRLADGGTSSGPRSFTAASGPIDLSNLSSLVAGLGGLLSNLNSISKDERKVRQNDLAERIRDFERARKQHEKEAAQEESQFKKEVDADKARLSAMKDMQKAFQDQVSGLYRENAFSTARQVTLSTGQIATIPEGMDNGAGLQEWLASQGATGYSEDTVTTANATLTTDIARSREALELYRQLRARGFDGPAFRELVGNADVETLRLYANLPTADLATIERRYELRDRLGQERAQFAGNAEYGGSVKLLSKASQESVAELKGVRMENREMNQKLARMEKQFAHIEKQLDKAPKETGKEVGAAVNGAATNGMRGRTPR